MDFQQPHRFMRPPPTPPHPPHPPPPQPQPPTMSMPPADPYLHHQSQRLPVPPPNHWYTHQFQYHHSSSPPPPPPPPPHAPPQHQQWAPGPPHSDHYAQPPPFPGPSPYAAHHPAPHNQYPPPPHPHQLPPLPPRPHVPPQIPQSYPQVVQDWGNTNWSHHQSWEYQANTNGEDWAAKARAWAAAKVASDSQQTQPPSYAVKEGSLAGESVAVYPGRDSSISPSVHQQEVPSSYSSITGDPGRGIDPTAMHSDYAFAPPAEPSVVYPSLPAVLPSGPQVDPSAVVPSPAPPHSGPIFGRMPGPSFQTTVSSINTPFGIGAGPELHPITTFSGDSYGVSGVPERPKKASVPNWLREEIIKKKPVIASLAQESQKEDALSAEDDVGDKSYGKGDQADSKSVASSRSIEEEDEDEDEVEAARTAALNQEIKRVLTEVLLKVTDELFDEIATKVLNEDDSTSEADHLAAVSDHKGSPFIPPVPISDTSPKVVQVKAQETNSHDAREESAHNTPVNVLGLANYASEDDEDNEIQSSEGVNKENTVHLQSSSSKFSKGMDVVVNGDSREETRDRIDHRATIGPTSTLNASIVNDVELGEERARVASVQQGSTVSSRMEPGLAENELQTGFNDAKKKLGSKVLETEKPVEKLASQKSAADDSHGRDTRNSSDKKDRRKDERSSSGKDQKMKELDTNKERGNGSRSKHDEKHKKERRIDENGSKDRVKEKAYSDSRKRPSPDYVKEGRREREGDRKAGDKEDSGRKRERTRDDKREKPRHTNGGETSRHKRHRSSSRDKKDGSTVSGASDSSNESSDNSRRKLRTKRHRSPTVRSKKRQVSRSPHSKHSQRRHSPYSSLETTSGRGRRSRSRSRSRSPVRRRR